MSMNDGRWTLDKRIPLALMLTIGAQTAGLAYWLGTLSARVAQLELTTTGRSSDADRITRLEVKLEGVDETLRRIEATINRSVGGGR